MESLHARSLLQAWSYNGSNYTVYCPNENTKANDAGFQYWYQNMTGPLPFNQGIGIETQVCTTEEHCAWLQSPGSAVEGDVAEAFQWLALATCVISMGFYAYHSWKATTGWEEVYVVTVELIKVCLELTHQYDSPATMYLVTGNYVMWIRYGEWLLTCPVILIHLSNITGLQDTYNKRTMMLLVSDLGTIVMGITAAACYAWPKWVFFFLGLSYGCNTYFHAAKVYVEAYHIVPKGVCRHLVRAMAWCFYVAWTMFPLLFVFGPEGFGIMSRYGSEIGHTIADIISKQTWGLLGHFLRVKIHEHIIIHGNITKPTKVKVAGMEIDTQEMVDEADPEGVNQGTKQLANRESFIIMRNRLREQGVDTRASFDDSDIGMKAAANAVAVDKMAADAGVGMGGMMGSLQPGRVILAVPDISMVDFFRQQFAALPVPIELVPALGVENTVALVQQAMQLGGLDCVLAHPEFMRDRSAAGLVARMHSGGQRVVVFGWSPVGPMREMIEASGADAWLEGPSFGTGINQQQLVATLIRAQQARRQQQQMQMQMMMGGGMMMGGVPGGMPMGMAAQHATNAGMIMSGMQSAGGMPGMPGGVMGGMGMAPNAGMVMGMGQQQQQQQQQQVQMAQMGVAAGMMAVPPTPGQPQAASLMGGTTNPLFNMSMTQQQQQQQVTPPGNVTPTTPHPAAAGAGGNTASEAEMLQQLMAEINRLKGELGEQ